MIMNIKATDRCRNCGDEFANHKYVADSITQYNCPRLMTESTYGFFCGGDPRKFYPDASQCSKEELESHRRACQLWNDAESQGDTPNPEACPSGWVVGDDGKVIGHVLKAQYGIGICTVEWQSQFEQVETDDEEVDERENPRAGRWV